MAYLTYSWMLDIVIILSPFLLSFYVYMTWTYNYWKDRNVPYAKPMFGLGNLIGLFRGNALPDIIKDIYQQFDGERFCGFFQFRQPALMIRDPKLIEQILIKDFSHFEDRPLPIDPEKEPLTLNLATLRGEQWRSLRHKLTPTFTSGKLKRMFQQMCNCGDNLLKDIERFTHNGQKEETKILISNFSSDVIASCAFGLQFDPDSPDGKKFMEMVIKVTGGGSKLGALRMGLKISFPELADLLGIRAVPLDAHDYFMAITKASIEHRLKENIHREDFFQLLLGLKAQEEAGTLPVKPDLDMIEPDDIQLKYEVKPAPLTENSLKFTDELIAAQSFVFLAAGAETVSISITVALHYIAAHADVQSRLHAEVDQVLDTHGSWTYQALKDMTYLDQVIQESQRMFPAAHIQLRTCTIPYRMPGSELVVEKGVLVVIPSQAMQTDPTYYPNPDTFDPDRFECNNFKPSSMYLPFGDGPRICIAMRFAILEMKVCLAKILSKYQLKPSSKTQTPLRYDPSSFNVKVLGGIWLTFQQRSS